MLIQIRYLGLFGRSHSGKRGCNCWYVIRDISVIIYENGLSVKVNRFVMVLEKPKKVTVWYHKIGINCTCRLVYDYIELIHKKAHGLQHVPLPWTFIYGIGLRLELLFFCTHIYVQHSLSSSQTITLYTCL